MEGGDGGVDARRLSSRIERRASSSPVRIAQPLKRVTQVTPFAEKELRCALARSYSDFRHFLPLFLLHVAAATRVHRNHRHQRSIPQNQRQSPWFPGTLRLRASR